MVRTPLGGLHPATVATGLRRNGWSPTWARTAAHEVDSASLRILAHEALDRPREAPGRPVVVVESSDPTRAEALLDEMSKAARPALAVVVAPGEESERHSSPGPDLTPSTFIERHRPSLAYALQQCRRLSGGDVVDALLRAENVPDLLAGLARALLGRRPEPDLAALRLAAQLGYAHRGLGCFDRVLEQSRRDPWWIPLESGWFEVAPEWRHALVQETPRAPVAAVAELVGALVETGAAEEAVELSLDAGCPGLAADVLAEIAPMVMASDRGAVLERWRARLRPGSQPRPHGTHAVADVAGPVRGLTTPVPPRQRDGPVPLAVQVLGDVEVLLDGRRVERWHGRLGRTALAFLVLRGGRRVGADDMAAALWPDAPAEPARNRLHVTMHRLRADLAAIDPRPVIVHDDGYGLHPGVALTLDTQTFDDLARRGDEELRAGRRDRALEAYLAAGAAYRDDLLAGERDDSWALLSRERYRVRLLAVLGHAVDLALEAGRLELAVDVGARLLGLDPGREELHRSLMRAHARLGHRHLAVRQYQHCVSELEEEFGLAPSTATVQLCELIRAQAPV